MLSSQRQSRDHKKARNEIAFTLEEIIKDFEKEWAKLEKSNIAWSEIKSSIKLEAREFNQIKTTAKILSEFKKINAYWTRSQGSIENGFNHRVGLFLALTECYLILQFIQK